MKKYRIEERYFINGTSEFLPQYNVDNDILWLYFTKFENDVVTSIKYNTYKEALSIINLDKSGLSDPLTVLYHDILDIK